MNSRLVNIGVLTLGTALLSIPILGAVVDRDVSTGALFVAALGLWCVVGAALNLRRPRTAVPLSRFQALLVGAFFFALALAVIAVVGLAATPVSRPFEVALFISGDILILAALSSIVLLVRRWLRSAV